MTPPSPTPPGPYAADLINDEAQGSMAVQWEPLTPPLPA